MAARVAVKTMLLHCAAAIARTIPPAAQECNHDILKFIQVTISNYYLYATTKKDKDTQIY